eukprot:537440_1
MSETKDCKISSMNQKILSVNVITIISITFIIIGNTGNVHGHGFGPVPLNKTERNLLKPTLKAYMNGTPIPGAAKSLSSGSSSRRGNSRSRSGCSGSSGDGSRVGANELARRFGDLDHRGGNAMTTG